MYTSDSRDFYVVDIEMSLIIRVFLTEWTEQDVTLRNVGCAFCDIPFCIQ